LGKAFQPPSIHDKNVRPTVVVIIVKSDAATRGLEQILIFVLPAEDCLHVQAGFTSDIYEINLKVGEFWRRRVARRSRWCFWDGAGALRRQEAGPAPGSSHCEHTFERENQCG